jgi:hypothetical protein
MNGQISNDFAPLFCSSCSKAERWVFNRIIFPIPLSLPHDLGKPADDDAVAPKTQTIGAPKPANLAGFLLF